MTNETKPVATYRTTQRKLAHGSYAVNVYRNEHTLIASGRGRTVKDAVIEAVKHARMARRYRDF